LRKKTCRGEEPPNDRKSKTAPGGKKKSTREKWGARGSGRSDGCEWGKVSPGVSKGRGKRGRGLIRRKN